MCMQIVTVTHACDSFYSKQMALAIFAVRGLRQVNSSFKGVKLWLLLSVRAQTFHNLSVVLMHSLLQAM